MRVLLIQADSAASRAVELYLQGLTGKNVETRAVSTADEVAGAIKSVWDAIILDLDEDNPEQVKLVKACEKLLVHQPVIRLGRKADHLITSGAETALDESLNKLTVGAAPLFRSISHLLERRRLERKVEELEEKLGQSAYIDSVTGLYNAGHFGERLEQDFNAALLYGHPLTLCLFEIAKFDYIVDAYSFTTADEVLKVCGEIVSESIRKTDYAGRIGAPLFGISFPSTALPAAMTAIERIRDALSHKVFSAKSCENFTIDVNYGVCQMNAEHTEFQKLLNSATKALQASKNVRAGHIEVSDPISLAG